jgi:DNA polymerase III subunit gamma/tau
MAYTVLARRYRSATFDEVVGQDHVARTLKRAIESGRVAHAFLFNGTRGVGKTSMARILAKSLNCHAGDGPTATPCLKCNSCVAIARGDDIDVIEIDAASNTGVDNIRELIENSQYRPAHSRFKVYIIDEVHMLSKSAFNALLKTLEEPPNHVKFILATTEPEKVLPTIHSRCQRYDFRNIPTREIAGHLRSICQQEKIKAEDDALLLVAKSGAGSMRDALSLLDRLLSVGESNLTVESIEQALGLPKSQAVLELAQAIGQGRVKDVLELADRTICQGLSPDMLVAALVDHLRNLLVIRTCGADSGLVEAASLSLEEMARQAKQFDAPTLTQDITILEDLRRQMRQVGAARALLDATLVRLALADQFTSIAELLGQVEAVPSAGQKKKSELSPQPSPRPPVEAMLVLPASPASGGDAASTDGGDDLPAVGKAWEGEKRSLSAIFKQARPAEKVAAPPSQAETSNLGPVNAKDLPAVWRRVLAKLEQSPGLLGVLGSAKLADISEDMAVVLIGPHHATFARNWAANGKKEQVAGALTSVLERPVGVRFEVDESAAAPAPPTAAAASPRPTRPEIAGEASSMPPAAPLAFRPTPEQVAEYAKDPLVAALMQDLGAEIVRVSEE